MSKETKHRCYVVYYKGNRVLYKSMDEIKDFFVATIDDLTDSGKVNIYVSIGYFTDKEIFKNSSI